MKQIRSILLIFSSLIVLSLTGCSTLHLPFPLPVKARVCYNTPNGSVCAGTDGKSVTIEGGINGYSK